MRIGLVGCVKSKVDHSAPAQDLYTSPLFRGRRAAVERTCDRWFVLSALHGLVEPDDLLDPYDQTLKDASRTERRRWSHQVLQDLEYQIGSLAGHTFEIHAGRDYVAWGLESGLRERGAVVELPVEGLTLGQQLSHYARPARG